MDIKGKNVPGTASEKALKQSMLDVFMAKEENKRDRSRKLEPCRPTLKTSVFALKWEATRGF